MDLRRIGSSAGRAAAKSSAGGAPGWRSPRAKASGLVASSGLLFTILLASMLAPVASAAPAGSIKTTDAICTPVNLNVGYAAKTDVYVRGDNLSPGDYGIEVTSPSGTLLGTSAPNTPLHVGAGGGGFTGGCQQLWSLVHRPGNPAAVGYDDTDNNGGEYKVTLLDPSGAKDKSDNFKIARNPALTLTKSASPTTYSAVGQTITYSYKIINTGNVDLGPAQFTISDDHIGTPLGTPFNCGPAGTTLLTNTGSIGSPSAGSFVTCTASYTITQADLNNGSVTNTATASGAGVTSPPATATVNAVRAPALTLRKSPSPTTYGTVGQKITYTYTVINTGNVNIGPAQFTVSDNHIGSPLGTPFNCGPAATTLTPNTGTLLAPSAGSFVTCTADYTITQADLNNGSVTNTASASGGGVTSPSVQATINALRGPALTLRKSASPTTYSAVGQIITYTYTVINTGNVNIGPAQFTVSDNHIAGGAPFNCGPANTTLSPNTGTIASPSAGSFVTCTATYTITQADLNNGSVTNTASASGGGVTSPTAQATVTAVVVNPPGNPPAPPGNPPAPPGNLPPPGAPVPNPPAAPTPTGTVLPTQSTPTPTPTSTVAGVTSPPKHIPTLPPTDTVGGQPGTPSGLPIILAGLALIAAAGLLWGLQGGRSLRKSR